MNSYCITVTSHGNFMWWPIALTRTRLRFPHEKAAINARPEQELRRRTSDRPVVPEYIYNILLLSFMWDCNEWNDQSLSPSIIDSIRVCNIHWTWNRKWASQIPTGTLNLHHEQTFFRIAHCRFRGVRLISRSFLDISLFGFQCYKNRL